MKKMRFHDLRHSCASLLLANGVPLKQIQDWLGHSDFSTTANIYAHLDYSSKLSSAQAMVSGMPLPEAGDFGSKMCIRDRNMVALSERNFDTDDLHKKLSILASREQEVLKLHYGIGLDHEWFFVSATSAPGAFSVF